MIGAFAAAHQNAGEYASAAGLTLGSVQSASMWWAGPTTERAAQAGPLGPNRYCGTIRQTIGPVKVVHGRKRLRFRTIHRCFVPKFVYTTLVVTWSASPSSSPTSSG